MVIGIILTLIVNQKSGIVSQYETNLRCKHKRESYPLLEIRNNVMKVCIIGVSGKLGMYMVQHALDRGYGVVGVCRKKSIHKLDAFKDRIKIIPGATNDRDVIKRAVSGCDAILTVLVPWGVHDYSSGTAKAVLDFTPEKSRLIFSCGWHISLDGQDKYPQTFKLLVKAAAWIGKLFRMVDINDQVKACDSIFSSDKRWTVVRCSSLEEGESQGLPIWRRHIGDPVLESDLTRRIDFALFMVAAIENDELVHKAPAIVGCQTKSALEHTFNK